MRIIKFSAENVKKLKVVDIKPDGSLVEITGPNGSGKSSVLDAIFYALKGAAEIPSQVVRKGTEHAVVKLDLGELLVTRHFKNDWSTRLTVEAASGARFPSPQGILDELIGSLSFDPLAFTRMKPKEQLEALRSVVKLEDDIKALDAEREAALRERNAAARNARGLEAQLSASPKPPDDTPDVAPDLNAIIKELDEAGSANTRREGRINQEKLLKQSEERARQEADEKTGEMGRVRYQAQLRIQEINEEAEKECFKLLEEQQDLYNKADSFNAQIAALEPIPARIDTSELIDRSNQAQVTAKHVNQKKHRQWLTNELEVHKAKVVEWSNILKVNEEKRGHLVAGAKMPVDGLSFNDNEVLYDGLPLVNASSAEQLRVSVALAMAANPKLRIIRVKDGSLLDANGLRLLSELAELNDFQVWVERVEDAAGRPCVIMEDGSVRS